MAGKGDGGRLASEELGGASASLELGELGEGASSSGMMSSGEMSENSAKDAKVKLLRSLQDEYDQLSIEYNKEHAALRQKYQKLYEPLYQKRYEIVLNVPNFWLVVLRSSNVTGNEISHGDKDALKHLKDIRYIEFDNELGYQLDFVFGPNPYFENAVLTKIFNLAVPETETSVPLLLNSSGTIIKWRRGKSLIEKMKRKRGSRDIKIEKCVSFFNFFNSIDSVEADVDLFMMEKHYTIGNTIRNKIIPFAFLSFEAKKLPRSTNEEHD